MNRRGLTLLELLVAVVICGLALTAVYRTFVSGSNLSRRIQSSVAARGRAALFFSEIEKDLKNSLVYTPVPFKGDNFAMSFASMGEIIGTVRYGYRDGSVFKSAGPQDPGHPVLRELRGFSIEYAYQDENSGTLFLPYWKGSGLPRAVRLSLAFSGRDGTPFSDIVVLPQGNMGKIN